MTTKINGSVVAGAAIALALVFAGVQFATAAHNTDGLAGYWAFDDGANPTADTSGHGNNGAVNGGAVFSGSALTFDGTNDFVEVAHTNNELDMAGAYSISAWVNVDLSGCVYRPIAFRGTTNVNDIEVYVQCGNGDLIVEHNDSNGGPFDYVGFDNLPSNTLFHLAVVFDGTNVQAYYNGAPATVVQQFGALTLAAPSDTDKGWWFGKVEHSAFGGTHFFKGLLDELRIYSSVLSPEEVEALHDYSEFTISSDTVTPAFNPVGTDHTVTVTIDPALAGIPVLFEVTGANPQNDTVMTDGDGVASTTYTSNGAAGTDTITACVDANDDGDCDEESFVVLTKVWLDKYVTGGGVIKGVKKPLWTYGGTVGFDLDGNPIGNFQIVDHVGKRACHLNEFSNLVFSGGTTGSPVSNEDVATFTGSGPCNNGGDVTGVIVVIHDVAEPAAGQDTIVVTGGGLDNAPTILSGGNFQVHPPEEI